MRLEALRKEWMLEIFPPLVFVFPGLGITSRVYVEKHYSNYETEVAL